MLSNLNPGDNINFPSVISSSIKVEKASGKKLDYKITDRREGDITSAYADTKRATEILGWKSKKTLEDALKDAWKWQKKLGQGNPD